MHLEQAVAEAIRQLVVAALPSLNAALRADTLLSTLPQPLYDVASGDVLLGDALDIWKVEDARIRIIVSPGHWKSGAIMQASRLYGNDLSGMAPYQTTFATDVALHFHPEVFDIKKHVEQSQARLRAQLLVAGWLRADCLNNVNAQDIKLASNEYGNVGVEPAMSPYSPSTPYPYAGQPLTDHLVLCMCSSVMRGVTQLGFSGSQTCYIVSATHTGSIY